MSPAHDDAVWLSLKPHLADIRRDVATSIYGTTRTVRKAIDRVAVRQDIRRIGIHTFLGDDVRNFAPDKRFHGEIHLARVVGGCTGDREQQDGRAAQSG